jgi:hypothetical protein
MAAIIPIRAVHGSTPVGFRPDFLSTDHLAFLGDKLAGSWTIAADGRLVCRWRVVARHSAA